ncbi:MAG TPA: hypothetical protein VMV69_18765 [Pirellulales bacterium]|nr:hypothetical protein [Pirellulales bacterium]
MVSKSFAKALRAFVYRKPFKRFTVELINGERIEVEHPEALVFRGGVAVYFSPKNEISIFDHEGVARVTVGAGRVASA